MISFRCLAQGFKFVFKSSSKVCCSDWADVTGVTPSITIGCPLACDDHSTHPTSKSKNYCGKGTTVIPFDDTRPCAVQCVGTNSNYRDLPEYHCHRQFEIEEFLRSLCGSLSNLSGQLEKYGSYPSAHGGHGCVWKARFIGAYCDNDQPRHGRMQTIQVVAVKVIHLQLLVDDPHKWRTTMKLLRREIVHWQKARHERILPLLGVCNDFDPMSLPSMVSPWMKNGDVMSFLKQREDQGHQIGRKRRLQIVYEVTEGLQYLHSIELIHGDLKGANVLIDDDEHACLCDFGLSRVVEAAGKSAITSTMGGSSRWMAPELLGFTRAGGPGSQVNFDALPRTSQQADVYAFACVALEILTGRIPYYYLKQDSQVVVEISRGVVPKTPSETKITGEEWKILLQCWDFDPEERPDISSMVEVFHAFHLRCD